MSKKPVTTYVVLTHIASLQYAYLCRFMVFIMNGVFLATYGGVVYTVRRAPSCKTNHYQNLYIYYPLWLTTNHRFVYIYLDFYQVFDYPKHLFKSVLVASSPFDYLFNTLANSRFLRLMSSIFFSFNTSLTLDNNLGKNPIICSYYLCNKY